MLRLLYACPAAWVRDAGMAGEATTGRGAYVVETTAEPAQGSNIAGDRPPCMNDGSDLNARCANIEVRGGAEASERTLKCLRRSGVCCVMVETIHHITTFQMHYRPRRLGCEVTMLRLIFMWCQH